MKRYSFFLLALFVIAFSSCDRDPYPLTLSRFDPIWRDLDQTGTISVNDVLEFYIQAHTNDPDAGDQFITDWEFSYTVNGVFAGILDADNNLRSNEVNLTAIVDFAPLEAPGNRLVLPGDRVEFFFWAADNFGTQIEQSHRVILQN